MHSYQLTISHDGSHFMTADLKVATAQQAYDRYARTVEAMSPYGFKVELMEWTTPVGRPLAVAEASL